MNQYKPMHHGIAAVILRIFMAASVTHVAAAHAADAVIPAVRYSRKALVTHAGAAIHVTTRIVVPVAAVVATVAVATVVDAAVAVVVEDAAVAAAIFMAAIAVPHVIMIAAVVLTGNIDGVADPGNVVV